ncbi:MAG TPA: M20/M25/M40 family metallo-hydrolase [Pirellulaceae bacterium]|nr:M20/M25/M40 family metallo-hydrolase [Pirellulaceae bacterium]
MPCLRGPFLVRAAGALLTTLLVGSGVDRVASGLDRSLSATEVRLMQDVEALSADEMQGRGVGTVGIEKAADYIRAEFRRLGLASGTPDGDYRQEFRVTVESEIDGDRTHLRLRSPEGQDLELKRGETWQALFAGGNGKADAEIVFAGYGITAPDANYDDYAGLDVRGKIVLLLRREPRQDDEASPFAGKENSPHAFVATKMKNAKEHGAAAVLMVNDLRGAVGPHGEEGQDPVLEPGDFGTNAAGIPLLQITRAVADQLLTAAPLKAGEEVIATIEEAEKRIDANLEPISRPLAGWSASISSHAEARSFEVANIVGVLEGEGSLADETIVIGAHYDHVGLGGYGSRKPALRQIHNGADDNASGTAALLELARRFVESETKPARRLVFIAFCGEERGLLGSNHYVSHPLFPLEQTVAMINFDMVGRLRENKLSVYGLGTAAEFDPLLDRVPNPSEIVYDRIEGVMPNSDHYGFHLKKIPSIHFFTGLSDEYHTPEDDVELINIEGMTRVVDLAEAFIRGIESAERRPTHQEAPTIKMTSGTMSYLGVVPDYSGGVEGLRLTGINPGSPAEKAGLLPGDIVVQMGEIEVKSIEGLADALVRYKAGEKVKTTVEREGKRVDVEVTLGDPKEK